MSTLAMNARPAYGAIDLLKKAHKYMSWALGIASCIHLLAISGYWLSLYLESEEAPVRTVRIMKYSELGPPPSISGLSEAVAPSVSVENPAAKPQIGIPVPVPDAEVSVQQDFVTQEELSKVTDSEGIGTGTGAVQIESDVKVENIEEEAPPADYVPVEKLPEVVKQVKPIYPEIARKAGMEGTVWVKVWVTKEGKIRDVQIVKSDAEIFNQASIDASRQFVFTPAISAAGPVAVWVTFPFKFSLRDSK